MDNPVLAVKVFANLELIDKTKLMDDITDAILDKFPDAGTDASPIDALVLRWEDE